MALLLFNTILVTVLLFAVVSANINDEMQFDTNVQYPKPSPDTPQELLFERSCHLSVRFRRCECFRKWRTNCCCMGRDITKIDRNLLYSTNTLFLYNTSITEIRVNDLKKYVFLEKLIIDNAEGLTNVNAQAFDILKRLKKLEIKNCPNLKKINGTLARGNNGLNSLILSNNGLTSIPSIYMYKKFNTIMDQIDLSGNNIEVVAKYALRNVLAKKVLLINSNVKKIEEFAFSESQFVLLNISNNPQLSTISPDAFGNITSLSELDLSHSKITKLPTNGLKNLKKLVLKKVPTLKQLPSVLAYNNLHKAEFTYAYHCCFFKYATREYARGGDQEYQSNYKEIQQRSCSNRVSNDNMKIRRAKRHMRPETNPEANNFEDFVKFIEQLEIPLTIDEEEEEKAFDSNKVGQSEVLEKCGHTAVENFYLNITCTPVPDALNPCEDIVSYPTLRIFLWPMWIIAIGGNISVWFIIAAVWQRRLRFHYFFMLNLSVADFLTGVYLAFLAFADWKTANEYYNYAVEWQTGWGCSVIGFINVFASELSIVSMMMIAFEIYYNARYAFYGKRMSSKTAYLAITLGYLYAFGMAALPLFGVSSYEVSSICLPLSIDNDIDQIYIIVGLTTTATAFAGMILNYVLINCMVRQDSTKAARQEDRQILVRTLVLIGTDMLCWLPTLFFGITAAMGIPLITLTNAKICLILFYPINSCANPLIYVYMTKIWKDAKQKAPFLEILTSKAEKSHNNRFYHNLPPNSRQDRGLSMLIDDDGHSRLAQTTQTTSLNSTPRGSNSSNILHGRYSSAELMALRAFNDNKNISSSTLDSEPKKRKSIPSIPSFRFRVSAIPEFSDISESSSNSQEENERRNSKKQRKVSNLVMNANEVAQLLQNEEVDEDTDIRPDSENTLNDGNSFGVENEEEENKDDQIEENKHKRDSGQGESLCSSTNTNSSTANEIRSITRPVPLFLISLPSSDMEEDH